MKESAEQIKPKKVLDRKMRTERTIYHHPDGGGALSHSASGRAQTSTLQKAHDKKMREWTSALLVVCFVFMSALSVKAANDEVSGIPLGLVEQLESDQYQVRDQAYGQLSKWTKSHLKTAPEQLYEIWNAHEQPEVKTRCYELMKESVISRKFGRGKGFVGILMDVLVAPKLGGEIKKGILIAQALPNTPAEKAGLKKGDLILGIDEIDFNHLPKEHGGADVRTLFQEYVKLKQPDDVIVLHLLRGEKKIDKKVTLMKRPSFADRGFLDDGSAAAKEKLQRESYFKKWLAEREKNEN